MRSSLGYLDTRLSVAGGPGAPAPMTTAAPAGGASGQQQQQQAGGQPGGLVGAAGAEPTGLATQAGGANANVCNLNNIINNLNGAELAPPRTATRRTNYFKRVTSAAANREARRRQTRNVSSPIGLGLGIRRAAWARHWPAGARRWPAGEIVGARAPDLGQICKLNNVESISRARAARRSWRRGRCARSPGPPGSQSPVAGPARSYIKKRRRAAGGGRGARGARHHFAGATVSGATGRAPKRPIDDCAT